MVDNPHNAALLSLLGQAREQARFFGELGAESIALDKAAPSPEAVTMPVKDDAPRRPSVPPAREEFMFSARAVQSPKPYVSKSTGPSQNLFESAAPQPSFAQTRETLEDIWRDIGDCTRCGLCEGRTQVVNTHGNRNARLMFIGEAPGADEDAQGKPFVGRAGQLLTKMIEAMGMKREDVIIGNVNRCRPPGNRQPTLEEAAICRPFLFREIAAIKPEVIVVMGNTALRNLLEVREGISRVRGQFRDFRGIKVMPTFHPAYLLRDPSKKRETWEDLKKVIEYLESTPAKSKS